MSKLDSIPSIRLRTLMEKPVNPEGNYVVYWMIAHRRLEWNFGLQRAVERAREFKVPLIILEPLSCDYPYACDRFHTFVLQGMAVNQRRAEKTKALYYPYIEPKSGAGKGLLSQLGKNACVVVTDDAPCFWYPSMLAAATQKLSVLLELVDSNGIFPLAAAEKNFTVAHSFRRYLQKNLLPHLGEFPVPNPLKSLTKAAGKNLVKEVQKKWPPASQAMLDGGPDQLESLPIDHQIGPGMAVGGAEEADYQWQEFLHRKLDQYGEARNHPDEDCTSGLSPYLHFGHISPHQIFTQLMETAHWEPANIAAKPNGKRNGWWGVDPVREEFLDQFITWRELGQVECWHCPDTYKSFSSLPEWAQTTLANHAVDKRPYVYNLEQLDTGQSHDAIWNAAQNQLREEGRIHNYLRMLWGKKILEWSPSPREALERLILLNDKYALDGRDPNSYSGILWVLGKYDRAWGPERPIYGKVRYMSSDSTRRKLRMEEYLQRYGDGSFDNWEC